MARFDGYLGGGRFQTDPTELARELGQPAALLRVVPRPMFQFHPCCEACRSDDCTGDHQHSDDARRFIGWTAEGWW
jgi:hypothetical protein